MRYSNIGSNGNGVRPMVEPDLSTTTAMSTKEIPYDYVALFKLEGRAGNSVEDVINISVDGAFVATAVGYSFIPARFPSKTIPTQTLPNGAIGFIPNDP